VDEQQGSPPPFRLLSNYPNPFNPSTSIRFSVDVTDHTTLEVFTTAGQRVGTLFDEVAQGGQCYNVRFAAGSFASGVYLYRLQSGGKIEIKRMVLLK
jgi:hypothetical protein